MQGIDKRRKYLKLPEVAELMGVHYLTAYRILKNENSFPYLRYTKKGDYQIPKEDFFKWLEDHRRK